MSEQTQDDRLWSDEQYAAYDLGMQTEREHQNALSKLAVRMHQEQIDDLEQRLAAVVAERDALRQRVAELEACADPEALVIAYGKGYLDAQDKARKGGNR